MNEIKNKNSQKSKVTNLNLQTFPKKMNKLIVSAVITIPANDYLIKTRTEFLGKNQQNFILRKNTVHGIKNRQAQLLSTVVGTSFYGIALKQQVLRNFPELREKWIQ